MDRVMFQPRLEATEAAYMTDIQKVSERTNGRAWTYVIRTPRSAGGGCRESEVLFSIVSLKESSLNLMIGKDIIVSSQNSLQKMKIL